MDDEAWLENLVERLAMVGHEDVPVVWLGCEDVPMVWLGREGMPMVWRGRERVPVVWQVEELVGDSEMVFLWMMLSFWRMYWNSLHGGRLSSSRRQ